MIAILFLFFAGLAALAFLVLGSRRRKMPQPLRALLMMGAAAIVAYAAVALYVALR